MDKFRILARIYIRRDYRERWALGVSFGLGSGEVLDPQSDPPSSRGIEDAVHCSKPWSPGLHSPGLCVLLLLVFQVFWGPGYPHPEVTKEVNKAGGTNDNSKEKLSAPAHLLDFALEPALWRLRENKTQATLP